ncbi:MAG: MFS transporter [Gemmatimonadetes bacterium]|nr:MFS transporter [Gemmatimonadota bacterium]
MTAPARTFNPFRVLAVHRNFRLFWFGQTASLIGTWMQQVSTAWLALELTNDAFMVGIVGAAGTLPMLLFSMPAGVFADKSRKLRLVRFAQMCFVVQATTLWWFTWSGHVTIGVLIALVLVSGMLEAFEIPARQSLIIRLVNKDDLQDAIALNSGGFNLARIIGPSIAAVVIAQLGIAWCFGINALSYVAVLIAISMIRIPAGIDEPGESKHSTMQGIREAFAYVRGDRMMWILIRVVALFSLLGIPILTMLPVMARDHLNLGAGGYGALMMSFGLGALLGALIIAGQGGVLRRGRVLTVSSVTLGLAMLVFGVSTSPILSGAMLVVCGMAMMGNNALINGLMQSRMPDALRARVMALYVTVYIGMHPVGSAVAGWFAREVGVSYTVTGMGTLLFVSAALVFRRYPELRRA